MPVSLTAEPTCLCNSLATSSIVPLQHACCCAFGQGFPIIPAGHTDGIFMGSLNDDGQLLLTSSFDQTCRVWDVEKGACLAQLQHSAPLKQGIITPDGTRALTVTGDNMAHLWDLSTGTEAHLLQVRAGCSCACPVQSGLRPGTAVRVTSCHRFGFCVQSGLAM